MSSEVTNALEEVTERRAISGADAAAHPALANTLARLSRPGQKVAPPLVRVPRSSTPPPSPACQTALTPAPIFDEDVQLLEDSGLLTLMPDAEELVEELSARFLIDEDAREIVHTPPQLPKLSSKELQALDEVDSQHLAFVETQGEILAGHKHAPPISNGPKIHPASLHEQALANGIAQYSDGVPSHNLERPGQISTTLRIRATRPPASTSSWRHLPVVLVFAAGIGAGVFFATKSSSSPIPASAAGNAVAVQPAPAGLADPTPALDQSPAAIVSAPGNPIPVVVPLGDEDIEVKELAPELALGESEIAVAEAQEAIEVEVVADDKNLEPAVALVPRKKARTSTSETSDSPSANQPATGTADPGVLMLAAKPPCSILIDGKDTGLMTPQRVLHLAPGKHKVTLVNEEHSLKESFSVSIRSGEKSKVIRDFTSKIK